MMPTPPVAEEQARIRDRCAGACAAHGVPIETAMADMLSTADAVRLVTATPTAQRILVAGDATGAATAQLALMYPEARLWRIAPSADAMREDDSSDSEGWASAIANEIEAGQRIRFVEGVFTLREGARPGDRDARTPDAVGSRIATENGPFDIFALAGAPDGPTRSSELRLASSALAPHGVVVMPGLLGPDGPIVRSGVFEFLRYNRDFHLLHAPYSDGWRAHGLLRRKEDGWFPGLALAAPLSPNSLRQGVRDALADGAALALGDRPILEAAVGDPVMGPRFRSRGGQNRTLKLTQADWGARFFDPMIDQIVSALEHIPGSGMFSGDLADFSSDEFLARLFARLAESRTPIVLAVTPPGEEGVAGPTARPAARVIDLAAGQGLQAYALAGVEYEAARHAGAFAGRAGERSSRHASVLLLTGETSWRDGRGRFLSQLSPALAAQREQVALQRLHAEAWLGRRLSEESERAADALSHLNEKEARLATMEGAAEGVRREHDAALRTLRAEIDRLAEGNAALKSGNQRLQQESAEHLAASQRAQSERDDLRRDLSSRLEAAERALAEHHDASLREAAALEALLAEARRRESATQAEAAAERDALRAELQSLREQVQLHRQSFEEADAALAALREQHSGTAEEAARNATALAGAAQRVSELEILLSNAQKNLADGQARETFLQRDRMAERQAAEAEASRLSAAAAELRSARDAAQAELAHARTEIEALHQRLSQAGTDMVAAACHEIDARVSLDALEAHLSLAQQAIEQWRASPSAFRADQLVYPERAPPQVPADDNSDLVGLSRRLHGAAADLSREVAQALDTAVHGDVSVVRRFEALQASHAAAMEQASREAAQRVGAAEGVMSALQVNLSGNDELVARIAARVLGASPAPNQAEDAASAGDAALARVASQRALLEQVLHSLEADRGGAQLTGRASGASAPAGPSAAFVSRLRDVKVGAVSSGADRSDPFLEDQTGEIDPLAAIRSWWRVYRETHRLVGLQRGLSARLSATGLHPLAFDADHYIQAFLAMRRGEALRHYIIHGEAEGRRPLAGFDPIYYAERLPAEVRWGGTLLSHFLAEGMDDGYAPCAELSNFANDARAAQMSNAEFFFRCEQAARDRRRISDSPGSDDDTPGSAPASAGSSAGSPGSSANGGSAASAHESAEEGDAAASPAVAANGEAKQPETLVLSPGPMSAEGALSKPLTHRSGEGAPKAPGGWIMFR